MKKYRSFWQYNVANWEGFLTLIVVLFILIAGIYYNSGILIVLMGVTLAVLVFKSIQDWKQNG